MEEECEHYQQIWKAHLIVSTQQLPITLQGHITLLDGPPDVDNVIDLIPKEVSDTAGIPVQLNLTIVSHVMLVRNI